MLRSQATAQGMRMFAGFEIMLLLFMPFTLLAKRDDEPRSPRLAALARNVRIGDDEALAAFWKDLYAKAPLIETIPEDARHRVTFIWRATNETARVTMMGGLPSANILKPLTPLANTDVWYLTEVHST